VTINAAAAQMRAGKLSPAELAKETFQRIRRSQPVLNTYITVLEEAALAQAREAEREISSGRYRGPLYGIPYAAKDLFFTRGVTTTVGSKIFLDFQPDYDAAVIERLREAGAILVAKAGLHEFAYGITNNNPHFGPVRNPWDHARIPGGSSGGSTAALAAGLCLFSLGSDTGGSVRIPASYCGVVGLKPTFGRISRYGVFPLGHTLDHVGPFALSVADAALLLEALAGPDPRDDSSAAVPPPRVELPREPSLQGVRIGVPSNYYFDGVEPDVEKAVRAAIQVLGELGAELREVTVAGVEECTVLSRLILLPEATAVHRSRLRSRRAEIGADVLALLDQGQFVTAADYLDAQRLRREFMGTLRRLFQQVDAVVTPATPNTAPPIGTASVKLGGREEDVRLAATRLVRALNVAGVPALSVPCGFDSGGLPIGLQIFGRAFDEAGVLRVGHAYEQATSWHTRAPAV
jgi:aspartyl-tRNA(Asn)/glutamyl-tRNA(Gln) amidotransferase subunit A